jgi:RNA polymerase sigma-70 factor, ECF subfamily
VDDALMARMVEGDSGALRDLMRRHGELVLGVCYRISGERTAAEDLTQETFLRVYRGAASYVPGRGARPWIVTIARNLALKQRRRRALEARAPQHLRTQAAALRASPDPSSRAEQGELGDKIQDALAAIDEPFRSALSLCAVQGLSYEEAAATLECSVKTLSSRLARARARFRQLLSPYLRGAT